MTGVHLYVWQEAAGLGVQEQKAAAALLCDVMGRRCVKFHG